MRLASILIGFVLITALSSCNSGTENREAISAKQAGHSSEATAQIANESRSLDAFIQPASFSQAEQSRADAPAIERKIIRNAELSIEIAAPAEGQRKLASIVESSGGFVVSSESQQQTVSGGTIETVNMQLRVPAAKFDAVIGEIRGVGSRVRSEKVTGQDVTEEFIDLEARLRTQRALEAQFLEIMKGASKVSDALEVNRQLAEVRNEIERVEGRRRFLENQASLSTIKVTLQTPTPLVSANTTGFMSSLKEAFGDGVDAALMIILGLVRVIIALIPVLLLLVLPVYLLWRLLRRRLRRAPLS